MGFNYVFKLTMPDGAVREITYQDLIVALGIADEESHGRPLTAGGVPQAVTVRSLVLRATDAVEVDVYHNGNQIL